MRVAPIGLVREYSVAQAFALAARAAAQTHGHPDGYLPAGCMAALVRGLVVSMNLAEATTESLRVLAGWAHAAPTHAALLAAQKAGVSVASLGEGWVGEEALAIGLHAALVGEGFEKAIRIATNHSADSDSTVAITGELVGAWRGAGAIPPAWAKGLDCAAELTELARD